MYPSIMLKLPGLTFLALAVIGCGEVTDAPCPSNVTLGCQNFDPPVDGSANVETGPQATRIDAGHTKGQAGAGGASGLTGEAGSPSGDAGGGVVSSDGGGGQPDSGVSGAGGSGAAPGDGGLSPLLPVCTGRYVSIISACSGPHYCWTGCATNTEPSKSLDKVPCAAMTVDSQQVVYSGTCVADCSQCP